MMFRSLGRHNYNLRESHSADPSSASAFRFTSTPFRSGCLAVGQSNLSQSADFSGDTGYFSRTHSHAASPTDHHRMVGVGEAGLCPTTRRISYRGKCRADILSLFMMYEPTDYVVEQIVRYLAKPDRLRLLFVCKSWYRLKHRLPHCFQMPAIVSMATYSEKENYTVSRVTTRSNRNRPPLATLVNRDPPLSKKADSVLDQSDVKEYLHACPVCSGPAFYRPSQWPNRLHCQASACGLSVCFTCHREHSPTERCVRRSDQVASSSSTISRQQVNPIDPEVSGNRPLSPRSDRLKRNPRMKVRLSRLALRRL